MEPTCKNKLSNFPFLTGCTNSNFVIPVLYYNGTTYQNYNIAFQDFACGVFDNYLSGGTYSNGNIYFSGHGVNFVVDVSSLLDDTNTYVTGATVDGVTLTLTRNDGAQINVDLSTTFTGNTSGSCISDLYVHNLGGCSPIILQTSLRNSVALDSNDTSFALGYNAVATGNTSFAFGYNVRAEGDYSYAEGYNTTASGGGGASFTNTGGMLVPIFYSTFTPETINLRGDITEYVNSSCIIYNDDPGSEGPLGVYTISNVSYDGFEKSTVTVPGFSYASEINIGHITILNGGYGSHAEGNETLASGYAAHAEGGSTIASGSYSHAEGGSTIANGAHSHAEGYNTIAGGANSFVEFVSFADGVEPVEFYNNPNYVNVLTAVDVSYVGFSAEIYEIQGVIGGGTIETLLGTYTISEILLDRFGNSTIGVPGFEPMLRCSHGKIKILTPPVIKNYSHAEGYYTKAIGNYSHAEGYRTTASGEYSSASGYYTLATGPGAHAEGGYSEASGDFAHAEGGGWSEQYKTTASGYVSHAEGQHTTASGSYSHAEGFETLASDGGTHAEGSFTTASGYNAHAEGYSTTASGMYSHAEGNETTAQSPTTNFYSDPLNSQGQGNIYFYSSALPTNVVYVIGDLSYLMQILGGAYVNLYNDDPDGTGNVFIGRYIVRGVIYNGPAQDWSEVTLTGFLGEAGTTIQYGHISYVNNSVNSQHAEGWQTTASGYAAHAEGYLTTASGDYSHAEGSQTTASGYVSHAEGRETTSSNWYSHAEGGWTVANNGSTHAEGYFTTASGYAAHSEGGTTTASGDYSHAGGKGHTTGNEVIASGISSFNHSTTTAGNTSYALGNYSAILGGVNNNVYGERSVVLGGTGITGLSGDTVYVPKIEIVETTNQIIMVDAVTGLRNSIVLSGGTFIITEL